MKFRASINTTKGRSDRMVFAIVTHIFGIQLLGLVFWRSLVLGIVY